MKWDTLIARGAAVVDRVGAMLLWFVLSLVLLALVLPLNPAKLGAYLWMMSKVAGAAAAGYGLDRAAFRGADPTALDGIEKAMAQTRRATLVAAAMIAAGLIG